MAVLWLGSELELSPLSPRTTRITATAITVPATQKWQNDVIPTLKLLNAEDTKA